MSRQAVSLKSRVRYDGRARTFDRRTELEKIPNPLWYTVGQVLRSKLRKASNGAAPSQPPEVKRP
jgi:hypothetical protein